MAKPKKTPAVKKTGKLAQNDIKSAKNRIKSTKSSIESSKKPIKSDVKKTTKTVTDVQKVTVKIADKAAKTAKLTKVRRNPLSIIKRSFVNVFGALSSAIKDHQSRRPHRSFRHTPRKIHQRPLQIEGYFQLSRAVLRQIWRDRSFFFKLLLVALASGVLLNGVVSQKTYTNFKEILNQTYQDDSGLASEVFKSTLLLISTAGGGGFNPVDTEGKQVIAALVTMLIWLAVVWYLRRRLAGERISFSDTIYNCGAPIVSMVMVALYMILQMIPFLIWVIFYSAAVSTDFATSGVEGMILQTAMVLMIALTVYWLEGSFLALVVATLPGISPVQAIKIAGDLTIGRRMQILMRLLWHGLQVMGVWLVIGLPTVAFDSWLNAKVKWAAGVPIVPLVISVLTLCSMIWTFVYCYFLYRRLIEDESQPA